MTWNVEIRLSRAFVNELGSNAWGGVFCIGDDWIAVDGNETTNAKLLMHGDRVQCFAAAETTCRSL